MARNKKDGPGPAELLGVLGERLKPPYGIVLGAPGEAARLAVALGAAEITAYQMDLHPAERLTEALAELGGRADVQTRPDLWDLPAEFQTVIYPAPKHGERELKIDMVEQAYHVLRPRGVLVVLTPYAKDDFFPPLLKKVFGKVHMPTVGGRLVLWCQRDGERPRRRHEVTFHAKVGGEEPRTFLSRPGTFAYGKFDEGSRALASVMEIRPGERILDVGCGCGTNGVFAGLRAGPGGHVAFADSNVRALALAEHNARANGLGSFELVASSRVEGPPARSFDVALANPPYLDQGSVAGLFLVRAQALLKPRTGRLYLVTRQPHQVGPMVVDVFGEGQVLGRGGYTIFQATRGR